MATLPTETARGGPGQDRLHGITSPVCTIPKQPDVPEWPLAFDAATWLALSDERDAELRLRLVAQRAEFERGERGGYERGYRDGREHEAADWMASLAPARAAARQSARTPTHAELEMLRWGKGGREHFADPRPGDYPGRGAA